MENVEKLPLQISAEKLDLFLDSLQQLVNNFPALLRCTVQRAVLLGKVGWEKKMDLLPKLPPPMKTKISWLEVSLNCNLNGNRDVCNKS